MGCKRERFTLSPEKKGIETVCGGDGRGHIPFPLSPEKKGSGRNATRRALSCAYNGRVLEKMPLEKRQKKPGAWPAIPMHCRHS